MILHIPHLKKPAMPMVFLVMIKSGIMPLMRLHTGLPLVSLGNFLLPCFFVKLAMSICSLRRSGSY
jgi:hypothetical protein